LNESAATMSESRMIQFFLPPVGPWWRLLAGVGLVLRLAAPADAEESLADRTLKQIVERERAVFARAKEEGDHVDQGRLRAEVQSLASSYDTLIQQVPDYAPAHVTYGLLLGRVGMAKEAIAVLLKADQLDPKQPLVKNQLAKHLAETGRPVEALPFILQATDLAPQEPLYHYQLGTLLHAAGDELVRARAMDRDALDRTMIEAFRRAAELAPGEFAYAYRHAEAFYDLATPRWDDALKAWGALEDRATAGLERETIRLHAANVLVKQGRPDHARALLATVDDARLAKQKQTLLDQLAAKAEK
jgi:tetratricopeptide (TPR) repeat protein